MAGAVRLAPVRCNGANYSHKHIRNLSGITSAVEDPLDLGGRPSALAGVAVEDGAVAGGIALGVEMRRDLPGYRKIRHERLLPVRVASESQWLDFR